MSMYRHLSISAYGCDVVRDKRELPLDHLLMAHVIKTMCFQRHFCLPNGSFFGEHQNRQLSCNSIGHSGLVTAATPPSLPKDKTALHTKGVSDTRDEVAGVFIRASTPRSPPLFRSRLSISSVILQHPRLLHATSAGYHPPQGQRGFQHRSRGPHSHYSAS